MSSIEDEEKHEYIPLLLKEKEMDSLKYADDDDESTDGNIEENEEKNEPSTSHKNTDGNIEENEEENEPSTSHKETERKDNKPPDDSVEETERKAKKHLDDSAEEMPRHSGEEEERKIVERLQNELTEMYASAIELLVETYYVDRSKPDDQYISSGYECFPCTKIKAARKGTKSYSDDQDDAPIENLESKKTIKEDERLIMVYTTSDMVSKTFRKDELFIGKDELKGMRERFDLKVRELLESNSVDVTHQDELDNTLLHYAVIGNSLDLLSKFPGTLNTKGNFGLTPLHIAALLDYSDVARELMNMKADIDLKDKYDKTPLLLAAKYGSSKVIEILLQRNASINQTDNQRRSVLHLATEYNNTDVLELILKKNRELKSEAGDKEWKTLLHMKTAEGQTALHQAVFDNRKEIVKILLQEDLDKNNRKTYLNMQDVIGKTALHHAAEDGSKEMVEILLQEGADIDCKDNDERTPLSYAAEQGMVEITRMLFDKCTDRWALDKKEKWETDHDIHLLIEEQKKKKKKHRYMYGLKNYERKLQKTPRYTYGLKNYERMAPIHYAAEKGHSDVVKIFSNSNSIPVRSGKGRNCLDIAIDANQVETVLEIFKSSWLQELLCNKTETENGEHQSPMRKLIVHMPDIAREVFNRCVTINPIADEFEARFKYDYLDDTLLLEKWIAEPNEGEAKPYTDDGNLIKRNHPLMIMVTKKRRELYDHPLVSALLKKKWASIGPFYLLNVLIYVLYLTMLTGFALDIQAPYQIIDIPTNASVSTNASVCFEDNVKLPEFAAIAKYFVIVLAVIELLTEIIELKLMFSWKVWLYIKEIENILEWITCICSIIFVVNTSGCTDTGYRPQWQWTCGTISVFLAWINLLLLIQKFDWIGIYVVMLYRISKVFMKFFLVFSLLIVAFAVTFHCLLRNQEQFSTFWISLVKTTEMMIGELDYTSIFIDAEVHYNVISHVFFYIFMLFMTIVVVNLMVGLAVDKIREFQKEAVITKKEMQIKFALELERPSISWIFEKVSSCLRFGRNEDNRYSETLQPSKHNWLQKKIGESWKLTEKDIKEALNSGRDGASTEITELKTDMKKGISKLNTDVETMKEEMKNINTNLMTIINNLKRPEDTASASRQPADY